MGAEWRHCLSSRAAQTARDLANEVKAFFVYMMTNRTRGVLYTGVTNDLERRVCEHQTRTVKGFTKQSKLDRLVYYENYGAVRDAITREKKSKVGVAKRKTTWCGR